MTNSPSMSSKSEKERPHKPKSAAQRASDANREKQLAIRANRARPGDGASGEHDTRLTKR